MEKTFWGGTLIIFLGLLIDTVNQTVSIPIEKLVKAKDQIEAIILKKKATIKQLQSLCGLLNFLGRAVIPGHAFTRRIYAYATKRSKTGHILKPHHHIRVNNELKLDLSMWLKFLEHPSAVCRPFMDFSKDLNADEIFMYSDASLNALLGFGAICQSSWQYGLWGKDFIIQKKPSIEYLKLFGVTGGILTWIHRFSNRRVIQFCDNISDIHMLNKTTSSCQNCMVLIRLLVLKSLIHNIRIFGKYVSSKDNKFADLLSRNKIQAFKVAGANLFEEFPTPVPEEIWPVEKIWIQQETKDFE